MGVEGTNLPRSWKFEYNIQFALSICCHSLSVVLHVWVQPAPSFLPSLLYALVVAVVYLLSHIWLFCDSMDCSLPSSSVRGFLQAKILEWLAIAFSRKWGSPGGLPGPETEPTDRFFTSEPPGKPALLYTRCCSINNKIVKFSICPIYQVSLPLLLIYLGTNIFLCIND